MEMVILTWSFHRSVKRIRWKQGYGIILKTNSFPRYEGITIMVIFPKALFLFGVSHTALASDVTVVLQTSPLFLLDTL